MNDQVKPWIPAKTGRQHKQCKYSPTLLYMLYTSMEFWCQLCWYSSGIQTSATAAPDPSVSKYHFSGSPTRLTSKGLQKALKHQMEPKATCCKPTLPLWSVQLYLSVLHRTLTPCFITIWAQHNVKWGSRTAPCVWQCA